MSSILKNYQWLVVDDEPELATTTTTATAPKILTRVLIEGAVDLSGGPGSPSAALPGGPSFCAKAPDASAASIRPKINFFILLFVRIPACAFVQLAFASGFNFTS